MKDEMYCETILLNALSKYRILILIYIIIKLVYCYIKKLQMCAFKNSNLSVAYMLYIHALLSVPICGSCDKLKAFSINVHLLHFN